MGSRAPSLDGRWLHVPLLCKGPGDDSGANGGVKLAGSKRDGMVEEQERKTG